MSSSPFVPREKLSAYQRWELRPFDVPDDRRSGPGERRRAPSAEQEAQIREQAYQAGLAEGMRRGALQAAGDVERLQAVVAGVRQAGAEIDQNVAAEVLALALEIARRMARRVFDVRPEFILSVVQDALARTTGPARQPTLALHPEDARLVRLHLAQQLAAGGWSVVEDARVARGGCVLQTAASQIDASAPSRWRQLTAALGQTSEWLEQDAGDTGRPRPAAATTADPLP